MPSIRHAAGIPVHTRKPRGMQRQRQEHGRDNPPGAQGERRPEGSLQFAQEVARPGSIYGSSANISKLVDEINASNKYIKQLVEAKSKSDSQRRALTNNLYPLPQPRRELKDVDVKVAFKGVVYISLADNVLFKTGSYEISSRATWRH